MERNKAEKESREQRVCVCVCVYAQAHKIVNKANT